MGCQGLVNGKDWFSNLTNFLAITSAAIGQTHMSNICDETRLLSTKEADDLIISYSDSRYLNKYRSNQSLSHLEVSPPAAHVCRPLNSPWL
jgi:hypothetical protein